MRSFTRTPMVSIRYRLGRHAAREFHDWLATTGIAWYGSPITRELVVTVKQADRITEWLKLHKVREADR